MLSNWIWFFWTPSFCVIGVLLLNASRIQIENLGDSDARSFMFKASMVLIAFGVALLVGDITRVVWQHRLTRRQRPIPRVLTNVDTFTLHKAILEANAKAEALANEVMGGDLKLWTQGKLFVDGKEMKGKYKILADGKVAFYPFGDYRSSRPYQFCIIPLDESVPLLDRVVAMYLMCKNDERKLWNTANIN